MSELLMVTGAAEVRVSLKPRIEVESYGTAEAVPLSKTSGSETGGLISTDVARENPRLRGETWDTQLTAEVFV